MEIFHCNSHFFVYFRQEFHPWKHVPYCRTACCSRPIMHTERTICLRECKTLDKELLKTTPFFTCICMRVSVQILYKQLYHTRAPIFLRLDKNLLQHSHQRNAACTGSSPGTHQPSARLLHSVEKQEPSSPAESYRKNPGRQNTVAHRGM